MRKFTAGSLLIFLLILSCNNNRPETHTVSGPDDEVVKETETKLQLKTAFPDLYSHLTASDSAFSDEFEGGSISLGDTVPPQPMARDELSQLRPYLIFNSDSLLAIDLISNNYMIVARDGKTTLEEGGPDMEAGVIDFEKNQRQRILFFGTMGTIMDARWQNDSTVLVASAQEVNNNKYTISIWKYIVPGGNYELFVSHDTLEARPHDYIQEKIIKPSKTTRAF